MKNKALALTLTMALLVFLLVPVPKAHSAEFSAPERVLIFLTDVVKLDMANYKMNLTKLVSSPMSGYYELTYVLESTQNVLMVNCSFRFHNLYSCTIDWLKGSPSSTNSSIDMLSRVKGMLQSYQVFSGFAYVDEIEQTLENVTELKPTETTVGNINLVISTNEKSTSFIWTYFFEEPMPRKTMKIDFVKGCLESFLDEWNWMPSTPMQAEAIAFLRDIYGIDVTKYTARISGSVEHRAEMMNLTEEHVVCKFFSDASLRDLDYTCDFINNTWSHSSLEVIRSVLPFYVEPQPTSILSASRSLMARYLNYAGDAPYLREMSNMLDSITELKNTTIVSGNMKLTVSKSQHVTDFEWVYTSNGIDFPLKQAGFDFNTHETYWHLWHFYDSWNLYKIGNADVNISKEEAIAIAKNATKTIPKLHVYLGGNWTVFQPKVVDEPVNAYIATTTREPLTLYPVWQVQLYFDNFYYGWYGVRAAIWADTGQLIGTYPTGIMGIPPSSEGTPTTPSPTPSSSNPQVVPPVGFTTEPPPESPTVPETESSPPPETINPAVDQPSGFLGSALPTDYGYTIAAITVLAVSATAGYLFYKRRK